MRVLLLAFLMVFLSGCKDDKPAVTIELHDGNLLKSSDWNGKWVYVNYWAEWCKPCAEEIPALNAFAKANPDVLVLGVNFDKATDVNLQRQVHGFHIDYGVVISDIQQAFPHSVPQGLPATIIFSPDGKLVKTLSGPQTVASLQEAKKL
jgi:thiol-disulfide isomerase/thioredoxin